MKIKIKRNTLGDTRTAERVPTFSEFSNSNGSHINDVYNMMDGIAEKIRSAGANHDWSKVREPHKSLFYRDLCNVISQNMCWDDGEWGKFHYSNERHHLNERCPDDVNLIDVLEMICDCVCAGMARSGSVYPIEISSEILQMAVSNTVEMCMNAVEVEEGDNDGK